MTDRAHRFTVVDAICATLVIVTLALVTFNLLTRSHPPPCPNPSPVAHTPVPGPSFGPIIRTPAVQVTPEEVGKG